MGESAIGRALIDSPPRFAVFPMWAAWQLLAQADQEGRGRPAPEQVPWELIPLILGVAVVFLVGAAIIFAVNRWLKQPVKDKLSASDQLARFRTLYEQGRISPEEFEKIRALLTERMKQELQMPASPPPAATGERKVDGQPAAKPPDSNSPAT